MKSITQAMMNDAIKAVEAESAANTLGSPPTLAKVFDECDETRAQDPKEVIQELLKGTPAASSAISASTTQPAADKVTLTDKKFYDKFLSMLDEHLFSPVSPKRSFVMKTLKRVGIGVGVVGLLASLIFGRDVFSYVTTAGSNIKSAVKGSVPIEFEINRAKDLVSALVPEIKKNMSLIAQEEVAVDGLDKEIAARKTKLEQQKEEMLTLKNDLNDKQIVSYIYGGKTFTRTSVETNLANRFERYQVAEATLGSLEKVAAMRRSSLDAAKKKLSAMLEQKRQLEVDLESLAARLKLVDLAKTTSNFNFDSSQLGRAKETVAALKGRLEVEERITNTEGASDEMQVSTVDVLNENIADRVTKYFDGIPGTAIVEAK